MRGALVLLALAAASASARPPGEVQVAVFGLFHPNALAVAAVGEAITIGGDRDSCVLRGGEQAKLQWSGRAIEVSCAGGGAFASSAVRVTGSAAGDADLELRVPDRIARRFHGRLDIAATGGKLVPVMAMPLETAVASVVAAEQVTSAPLEALKAQAVAARSFFTAAGRRHRGFDFCDTTHCQFLREPPRDDHPAARAARETAGLILTFRDVPIAAFYSANCGGTTRPGAEAGLQAADGYPFFSVACPRRGGQGAGERRGHGVGLCQEGAAAMAAEQGASFAAVLQHYYPGTTLTARPR